MLPTRTAFSYDYQRIDAMVAQFIPQWRRLNFDAVVAIARGGLTPAVMAATALSLPLFAVMYARNSRQVSWFTAKQPLEGSRILLVEDIAGRGTTLSDSIDFLQNLNYEVSVFTLAYDDASRIKPDYGIKIPKGFAAWFPWERESITPAFATTANQPDRPLHEYASWAIDLDGILLPDLPERDYAIALSDTLARRDVLPANTVLPDIELRNLTIITGRPEQDRSRTQAWLSQYGFNGPLIMRDESRYNSAQTAVHKADAILAGCHTHFIESDARQALEIANQVKVARVLWWDGAKILAVYANAIDQAALA